MDESLSVLLVTLDYPPPPGGIQTVVRNLERGLDELGHEVHVLHVDTDDFDWTVRDLVPWPRWAHSLRGVLSGDHVYLNTVHREAVDTIERVDPDVVHAMHVMNWPGLVVAQDHGVPTVLSTHALELADTRLATRAVRDSDCVHAVSEFTESLILDLAAVNDPQTVVIPPSIDVPMFRINSSLERSGPGDVVTIGRLVDRKNVETLVEAWQRIDEEVKEDRDLVVVGNGPNRERLERLASNCEDVRFTGWVDEEEKRRLLAEADVFAMVPRRNGYDVEGFGIVYIEAQAAGTPVVGSRHGGVPEAIGDGGILVEDEDDPDEVAAAVETLLTDGDVRRDCLAVAEERIGRFDVPAVARKHVRTYYDLLTDASD